MSDFDNLYSGRKREDEASFEVRKLLSDPLTKRIIADIKKREEFFYDNVASELLLMEAKNIITPPSS